MSQNKSLLSIEQLINKSTLKFGIPEAKVTISATIEGAAQATIIYQGNEAQIKFTKPEVEAASKGFFSSETQRKISDTLMNLAPRVGPPFKPSN